MPDRPVCSYVLPLRWTAQDDVGLAELSIYLRRLARMADVVVVDGSRPDVWRGHHARWIDVVRHVPPDADLRFLNGKVNGVITGVRAARCEAVVVADDDVRYDEGALRRVVELLEVNDLVRPQNVFDPMPWHARWDTARTLLNRAFGADHPGTFGLRRSTFVAMGGYDGDILFENLELVRTVRAAGGRVASPLDLFVPRLPPSARRFWSQRVRQAYDDLAQPARLLSFLAVLPALAAIPSGARRRAVVAAALVSVAGAEAGRRRGDGGAVFPRSCSLFAPAWVAERAVCSWLAVGLRLFRGGVRYGDVRLRRAAHPMRELRRRTRRAAQAPGPGGGRSFDAVAEQLPA